MLKPYKCPCKAYEITYGAYGIACKTNVTYESWCEIYGIRCDNHRTARESHGIAYKSNQNTHVKPINMNMWNLWIQSHETAFKIHVQ